MPRGKLTEEIKRKISPITILLVPIFFTYSGPNTRLDTVNSLTLLALAFGILLVSVAAKFGACWFAARLARSEEHTSELQSLMRISYAVFCLKKKKPQTTVDNTCAEL